MLHNTGPFGPKDVPVNMGAAVNVPELSSSVNIAQNLNNIVKMSHQASHSREGSINIHNYVGYAGSSLSNNPQIHHFQHRHNLDFQTTLSAPKSNLLQSTQRQNGMLPENHNSNVPHCRNPMESSFLNSFNNFNHSVGCLTTPASYFAEITNRKKLKDTNITEHSAESSDFIKQDKISKQTLIEAESNDVGGREENMNADFSINHITMEMVSKLVNEDDKELALANRENNQNILINTSNRKSLSESNNEHSESDVGNMAGNLETSITRHKNQSQDSDPEDMIPLSFTRSIKQEPLDEDEIETDIVVKVELVSSWTDTDHMHPFLKDIHGVVREDSSHCNIIDCESSVAEATENIKNGLTTDYYFECPNCCLLFNHPKRFLVHTKWHSFGLANKRMIEEAHDKVVKRRQRNFSTKNTDNKQDGDKQDGKGEEVKQDINGEDVKPIQEAINCKNCDKTFANKTSLRNHRHKFHPNREHECKICHKVVLGWFGLKTHMVTHNTEPGFHCDVCPKKFKHAHSLAKHRDTHLEKTHACSDCPKKFGSQKLLKMHMRTHERMRRGPTFSCSYCAKAFYESYTLQVHERTHRNERPFQCQICNTSYGTNSSLKRHMKVSHTHSSSKPFECSTCHRCFVSELIRDRHAAREHGTPGQLEYACTKCTSRYLRVKDLQRHMCRMHPKGKKRRKDSETD